MKKLIIFVFSIVLLGSCGSESAETVQENKYEVLIENSCGFDKDVINQKVYAFASDIDADNALEKIMKLTGLPPNFEIKSANVDNACAVVECDDKGGCKRIIYYNQEFIEKMNDATNTDYTELAILAHEIGHHLSGHTIAEPKNRHEEELEADKFAGFILHQLGASIETAKNVFSYSPEEGSQTHPPKVARIAAITSGWYDSKRKRNSISKSSSINEEVYIIDGEEISLAEVQEAATASEMKVEEYLSLVGAQLKGEVEKQEATENAAKTVNKNNIVYNYSEVVESMVPITNTERRLCWLLKKTMKPITGKIVEMENGTKVKEFYVENGLKEGNEKVWFESNGQLQDDINWHKGLKEGVWKRWTYDGSLQWIFRLSEGYEDGRQEKWYNGKKIRDEFI